MDDAFIHVYWGIGDSIYLNPSLRLLAQRHKRLFACTPFPLLHYNIPNFCPVNPFDFPEYLPGGLALAPIYYEHCFFQKLRWQNQAWIDRRKEPFKVYDCNHSGSGFREGSYLVEEMLAVANDIKLVSPRLFLPRPTPFVVDHMFRFLHQHNPEGKPLLIFHPGVRTPNGKLQARACSDTVLRRLFDDLKTDYFLLNATKWESTFSYFARQQELPVYHCTGWYGFECLMALVQYASGVVLQGSCCLLPIGQALGKPVLVGNGACGLPLVNQVYPGLPPEQRNVFFMEPDTRCDLSRTGCGNPQHIIASYGGYEKTLAEFRGSLK